MGVNLFIRKTFSAKALKSAINEQLNPKIRALRTDPVLANTIATMWADRVTKYVPRSNSSIPGDTFVGSKIPEEEHLQFYTVSDGRVIWRRKAAEDDPELGIRRGEEIAYKLYMGPLRGKFHRRLDSRAKPHKPQPYWDLAVTPGTKEWQSFVKDVTPTIIEWMNNNGQK